MLASLFADLRQGARILRHAPGLSAVIVATLALALGASVAAFSVLNATLLRPLPHREPERVRGLLVSATFFETLGVSAGQGRTFRAEEEQPGREHVVVVSHALWQRLGGDASLLGSVLRLNAEPYEVVGIMPPGFRWGRGHGREAQGDVWAPFALTPERVSEASRGTEFLGLAASRLLRRFVFGVTVTDPVTYAVVGLLLGMVSLAACTLPAWRASRADPVQALRAE